MTSTLLAVCGTLAAATAAGLLLWSSMHASREVRSELGDAKQDRAAIRSEVADVRTDIGTVQADVSGLRTEVNKGFDAIMKRLPAPAAEPDTPAADTPADTPAKQSVPAHRVIAALADRPAHDRSKPH